MSVEKQLAAVKLEIEQLNAEIANFLFIQIYLRKIKIEVTKKIN